MQNLIDKLETAIHKLTLKKMTVEVEYGIIVNEEGNIGNLNEVPQKAALEFVQLKGQIMDWQQFLREVAKKEMKKEKEV